MPVGATPLDFDLEIGEAAGGRYAVAVLDSPAGEARQSMVFPYDELALRNHLQAVTIALLSSGRGRRRVAPPEERTVQDFGTALFGAVFAGDVGRLYELSRAEARSQGVALRLKLRCRAPELSVLPWEFLYDPTEREYLCLSRQTPLVRYLEVATPLEPLRVALPLRVLGVVASPRNLPELDVAREKQRIDEALAPLVESRAVELTWLTDATWRQLQQRLNREDWHVFHFVGHGEFDQRAQQGVLAFCDEDGNAHLLGARDLGILLGDHHTLRLAMLNSCEGARAGAGDVFSSTAAELVRRGTPGVVAMQYMITDLASIELARSFYDALAHGLPVDTALAEARKALCLGLTGTLEWGTPVLFMRAPDGVLFDVTAPPPPAPTALPPVKTAVPIPASRPASMRGRSGRPRILGAVAGCAALLVGTVLGVRALSAESGTPPPPTPPAGPSACVPGVVSEGCGTEAEVEQIQKLLNRHKCYERPGVHQEDGKFRGGTEKAVERFQELHRLLPIDGRVDARTLEKLNGPTAERPCVPSRPSANGPAAPPVSTVTALREPEGIGVAATGEVLVVDNGLRRLVRVNPLDGTAVVLAGTGTNGSGGEGGPATEGQLSAPWTVAQGPAGVIYIGDQGNHDVRRVRDGVIETIARGLDPKGMAVDGGRVYVSTGHRVVRIEQNGEAVVIAGADEAGFSGDGGPASEAMLHDPNGIAVRNGEVYVADAWNGRVRRIAKDGTVDSVLDGLNYPTDVGFDAAGNLYVLEGIESAQAIRKVTPGGVRVTVVGPHTPGDAGDGGPARNARFGAQFEDFAIAPDGTVYVLDRGNVRLRRIEDGTIDTVVLR